VVKKPVAEFEKIADNYVTIEGHDGTRPNIEQVFYTLYHPVF
jgi:hypothetical protein